MYSQKTIVKKEEYDGKLNEKKPKVSLEQLALTLGCQNINELKLVTKFTRNNGERDILEAVSEVISYDFDVMGLTCIGAVVFIENEASNKLLGKVGFFQLAGRLVEQRELVY